MEPLWYIVAAPGTGIGTGLAGISAATVVFPAPIRDGIRGKRKHPENYNAE